MKRIKKEYRIDTCKNSVDGKLNFEEIIRIILRERQDLEKENVLEMIEKKMIDAEGYLTDEGAALILASELEVEIPRKKIQTEILIKDLVADLTDVTLTGEITNISSSRTFTKKDGTTGHVGELTIFDETGRLRVVLWNEKTRLINEEKMRRGQRIKIFHGYTREGIDGRIELHLGSRGSIRISQQQIVE